MRSMKEDFLQNFPKFLSPLISMALEAGINYQEFDHLIKQSFVTEAERVIEKQNKKATDASVSTASGLSRGYVKALRAQKKPQQEKWISLPSRVLSTWVAKKLDDVIEYTSKTDKTDFVSLSKSVTTEKSPKTILNELIRLGQVELIDDNQVRFTLFNNTTKRNNQKIQISDFADNLAWHTLAGAHLVAGSQKPALLEQAVKIDGVFENSAQDLSRLGKKYWQEISKKMIDKALPISEKEEQQGGKHKVTFGVYCYYE